MANDVLAKALTPEIPGLSKGGKQLISAQKPFLESKQQLSTELADTEKRILEGQQSQKEAEAQGAVAAGEKYVQGRTAAQEKMQTQLAEAPIEPFIPTKDTAQDIAGLFSVIGVLGMLAGRSNAQQAMGAMNGMLEGHRKGRADLYKQERDTYEKNFKALIKKHEELRNEFKDAMETLATDKELGMQKAHLAAVKSGSSIIQELVNKGRIVEAAKIVNEAQQGTTKAIETSIKEFQHAEDMAQRERHQREMMASKEKVAGLRQLGGARSATNERYANTVFRSSNEVLRSLELIEQIGLTTGGGALGGVVGKGSIPSEVQRYIGQAMTDEQQKNYNTAMSGLALEMAYVLNGGYKPDASTVSKIETLLSVGPNDTAGTAAYKFADANAKLKAAIETSPAYTEDQKKTKDMLMQKVERYATPEVVYERVYGVPERREPTVRSGQYPTPKTQAEFDALAPGAEYIDPDDGKLYKKRAK